jgi:hypothetical protein
MPASDLARWGALSSLLGGAAFVGLSFDSIARPDPERYRTAIFLVTWLLSAGGIVGLHVLQRGRSGRLGRAGFWATVSAMLVAAAGTAAYLAGADALRWLEAVGLAGWVAGMLLLGVATVRARVAPAWVGAALILAEPATVLAALALSPWVPLHDEGSYSGAVANGMAFLALGIALRSTRRESDDAGYGRRRTPAAV